MAKVITVSRTFPDYHPKGGQQTFFVEKILNALKIDYSKAAYFELLVKLNSANLKLRKISDLHIAVFDTLLRKEITDTKIHTVRSSDRWNQGDMASLRVWSGIPYHSPQIIFTPDIPLVKVMPLTVQNEAFYRKGIPFSLDITEVKTLAKNDGLTKDDLCRWFKTDKQNFDGQILCWNDPEY